MTAGSFILHRTGRQSSVTGLVLIAHDNINKNSEGFTGTQLPLGGDQESVGWIIEVVDSLEKNEDPAVTLSIWDDIVATQQADRPGQYVKVNLFRDHSLISDSLFTGQICSLSGSLLGKSK